MYIGLFFGTSFSGLTAGYSNIGVAFGRPSLILFGLGAWEICTLLLVSAPIVGLVLDLHLKSFKRKNPRFGDQR